MLFAIVKTPLPVTSPVCVAFVTFSEFAAEASKRSVDITPETDVVATGSTTSAPSEDTIVLASVVPVILKLVVTLVFLAVLSEIKVLIALANLAAVTASSAS